MKELAERIGNRSNGSYQKLDVHYEQIENVDILTFNCDLTADTEDDLNVVLLKAIYSIERTVLNLEKVTLIDDTCLELFKRAFKISDRLKNRLMLINIPDRYRAALSLCGPGNSADHFRNTANVTY